MGYQKTMPFSGGPGGSAAWASALLTYGGTVLTIGRSPFLRFAVHGRGVGGVGVGMNSRGGPGH